MPATAVPKSKDFMEWYNEIVELAELTDKRYPIKGMNIWRPAGWAIMSRIDQFTRSEMERTKHDEVSFPLLIPEKLFLKEADQIKGFGSEVFWVTHAGDNPLPDGERWVVRPTSECAMYEIFPLWIRSHGDLPLQTYQICNVFRYETKQTRAFMRVREIHFFEDHSVFADEASAREHVELDLQVVRNVYDRLALPALTSRRPDWDKFPGAVDSTGADVVMPSGRTLQCATVHYYGTNFAKAYGMKYEFDNTENFHRANPGRADLVGAIVQRTIVMAAGWEGVGVRIQFGGSGKGITLVDVVRGTLPESDVEEEMFVVPRGLFAAVFGTPHEGPDVWRVPSTTILPFNMPKLETHRFCHQTTYGMSERLVGAIVGCHGDDNGLIIPPEIAPIQVVIVPVLFKGSDEAVLAACREVKSRLEKMEWRGRRLAVELDGRNKSSGEKFYHWELRGVPLRLEVGPKDVEKKSVFAARRDVPGRDGKKPIPLAELEEGVTALLADVQRALFERQAAFVATRVKHPATLAEAQRLDKEGQAAGVGYILAMPVCSDTCAAGVEKGLDIKTLGVPAGVDKDQNKGGACAVCGKPAKDTLRFARTY